jgi:hypothetical protein
MTQVVFLKWAESWGQVKGDVCRPVLLGQEYDAIDSV